MNILQFTQMNRRYLQVGIPVVVAAVLVRPSEKTWYIVHVASAIGGAVCFAVAAVAGWDHALMANLVWSAKESALKALGEGLRLDTRSVEMDTAELKVNGDAWSPLVVTGPGERIFRGWWRVSDGFVWTVLT